MQNEQQSINFPPKNQKDEHDLEGNYGGIHKSKLMSK